MQKNRIYSLIALSFAIPLLFAGVYGLSSGISLPSSGQIAVLQLYSDSQLTNKTTLIDWGSAILPSSVTTKTYWVKNLAGKSANLTFTATNWNPANATNYLSVTWDREGYNLTSGGAIQCTFTLTTYANITDSTMGSFSYTTNINGVWG